MSGRWILLAALCCPASSAAGEPAREQEPPSELVEISPSRAAIVADLPSISVTFRRPVQGLRARDLIVNGFPAKEVAGSGAGPYTFTGFRQPEIGYAAVSLAPGRIEDQHHFAFSGATWTYQVIDPNDDDDHDGLPNVIEIDQLHTDPMKADTDGDNMPDPYELAHPCLSPIVNEAFPTLREGRVIPGLPDIDHDGTENRDEFLHGTDPCDPNSHPPRSPET